MNKFRGKVVNEDKKELLGILAEYEESVIGYHEKVAFRDRLKEIIDKNSGSLSMNELRTANQLLNRIQDEINNFKI